jgi:hypothetical protein
LCLSENGISTVFKTRMQYIFVLYGMIKAASVLKLSKKAK